jgi:hypothetical protein
MQSLKVERDGIVVSLSQEELAILNNALNEIANGVRISDADFETRIGFTRAEVRDLLARVSSLLKA